MQQQESKPVSVVKQCLSTNGMFELDNLKLAPNRGNNPNGTTHEHDDDDDDDEGVLEEESDSDNDDDGISSSYHSTAASSMHHHHHQQHIHEGGTPNITYFLGHAFNSATDRLAMHTFQKSLYWFTYRNDLVVPLRPYNNSSPLTAMKHPQLIGEHLAVPGSGGAAGMRSDAGWGCMLRSAQMMLAQAVRRHYNPMGGEGCNNNMNRRGSDASNKYGSKGTTCKDGESDPWEAERIAHWFADFPNHADDNIDNELHRYNSNIHNNDESTMKSTKSSRLDDHNIECYGLGGIQCHWYSLHQMVAAGIGLGILPGEWYGPTTACHVLRELNEIHCDRRERLAKRLSTRKIDGSDDGVTPENASSDDGNNSSHQTSSTAAAQGDKSLILQPCDMFRVHISTEGCIYVDAIMKLMTRRKSGGSGDGDGTEESNNHATERKGHNDPLLLQVDEIDDPLRQPTATSRNHQSMTHDGTIESTTDIVEWDTSLLLLLPLRLGIHNISISDYGSTLAKLIAFPHSVGLLGGTPRHALWFYGADATYPPPVMPLPSLSSAKPVAEKFSSDQDCVVGGWYGLDPHTVQLAPRGTRVLVEQSSSTSSRKNNLSNIDDANKATYQWQVQITDTYLRSLHISPTASHPNNQRSIPLSKLDPSCALGFYIRDHADFVHFQHLIKSLSEEHCRPNKLPDIITVLEKTPNYEMDVSSAIKDMIGRESGVVKDVAATAASVDELDGFSIKTEDEDGTGKEYVNNEDDDDDDDFVLV